jgi:hypothetical protein
MTTDLKVNVSNIVSGKSGNQINTSDGKLFVGTESFSDLTGTPDQNTALQSALDAKQNKLTAGENIEINNATNTISATDTKYTSGTGININQNAINNTGVLKLTQGTGIAISGTNDNLTITNTGSTGMTFVEHDDTLQGEGTTNKLLRVNSNLKGMQSIQGDAVVIGSLSETLPSVIATTSGAYLNGQGNNQARIQNGRLMGTTDGTNYHTYAYTDEIPDIPVIFRCVRLKANISQYGTIAETYTEGASHNCVIKVGNIFSKFASDFPTISGYSSPQISSVFGRIRHTSGTAWIRGPIIVSYYDAATGGDDDYISIYGSQETITTNMRLDATFMVEYIKNS